MTKEGDLWDDSALVNAFDQAITKYKKMHDKSYKESSNEAADVNNVNEDASTVINENNEPKSLEIDNTNNHEQQTVSGMGQASHSATAEQNKYEDPNFPQDDANGSQYVPMQDPSQSYPDSQAVEDFNQLYQQYYEIEEQRQKILQKLQQFGGWHYSCPGEGAGSGMQWGTTPAPQEQQYFTNQAPQPAVLSFCCPHTGQCTPALCCSLPVCSLPGSCPPSCCTDSPAAVEKQSANDDAEIVQTAMGAANKAISTLKQDIADRNEKQKSPDADQRDSSETDISVVLNAWYSAGFYTGKYLTEQSLANK